MSLQGLSAMIQLESTRLEGHKLQSQNFEQSDSSVRQRGMQHNQRKGSMKLEEIRGNYEKAINQADVSRIEKKLKRERAAEQFALDIAGVVSAASIIDSVASPIVNDLIKGTSDLGNIPKSMQVDSFDPSKANVIEHQHPDSVNNTVYIVGSQNQQRTENGASFGEETVYVFDSNGSDGDRRTVHGPGIRAATVTSEDKRRILGDKYADMSFNQIYEEDPALAEKLTSELSHGISRDEVSGFTKILDNVHALESYNEPVNRGLEESGKLKGSSFKDVSKNIFGGLVQSAKAAVPFYQAYLKAKSKADETAEQLEAAKAKLAASVKKLNELGAEIDLFGET